MSAMGGSADCRRARLDEEKPAGPGLTFDGGARRDENYRLRRIVRTGSNWFQIKSEPGMDFRDLHLELIGTDDQHVRR
jgi:hypothetical protein